MFSFRLPKKKRWKGGGKTNFYFLFGSSGKAEGQGTVGEGRASLCLNYYAKNKTKSSLPYLLWKVGPLPDSWFSLGAGSPKLLQPLRVSTDSGGRPVKVSKEAGTCKAVDHLTACLGRLWVLGESFIALMT